MGIEQAEDDDYGCRPRCLLVDLRWCPALELYECTECGMGFSEDDRLTLIKDEQRW